MRVSVGAAIAALSVVALLVTPSAIAVVTLNVSNVVVEATSSSGAPVTFSVSASDDDGGDPAIVCTPPEGTFAIGNTPVECTATDPDDATDFAVQSFTVTVQDTTPPVFGPMPSPPSVEAGPGGTAAVSWTNPTATDAVDTSVTVGCTPASGSSFSVGTTQVTCTAADDFNPPTTGNFDVTVTAGSAPTVNIDGPTQVEATSSAGAAVNYSVTASEGTPTCDNPSGHVFPLGGYQIQCTATDGSGNTGSDTLSGLVVDTTPPNVANHANMTSEATGPAGANVNYTPPNATDTVDGTITADCSPSPGVFAIGTTTITCNAEDSAGNSDPTPETFTITVSDTTPPAVAAHANVSAEALSGAGATVNYTPPTATDVVDGPSAVSCSPASGGTFPLGNTTITCTASDTRGNTGTGTFVVTIGDSTPPVITPPASIVVSSGGKEKIPASTPAIAKFLDGAIAIDRVNGKVEVTNNAPAVFPLGKTVVTFSAQDKNENKAYETSSVTVVEEAVAPVKPVDRTPPGNVRSLRLTPGNHSLTLTWDVPTADDFDHVVVLRAISQLDQTEKPVFRGDKSVTSFTDRKLRNDLEYRYLVVSYDEANNRSVGVAIVGVPRAPKLIRPAQAERVSAPPLLTWVPTPSADYYNVQLIRLIGKTKTVKILSVWPAKARFQLTASWIYDKKRFVLTPGRYRWFVWPGFGPRKDADYGTGLGQSLFVVVKKKAG